MSSRSEAVSLFVKKSTDLMQPLLLTYGLAELVYEILPDKAKDELTLEDLGYAYRINTNLSQEILLEIVQTTTLPHLIPAILKPLTKLQLEKIEAGTDKTEMIWRYVPHNFTGEVINYFPIKKQPTGSKHIWDDARYPIWAHICSNFVRGKSMSKTYPLAVHIWHAHQQCDTAKLLLFQLMIKALTDSRNDLIDIEDIWLSEVKPLLNYETGFEKLYWGKSESKLSMLSIISPGTVKGMGSQEITDSFSLRQPADFWLAIYLTLAGFVHFSFPYTDEKDAFVNIPVIGESCKYVELRELVSICRQDYDLRRLYSVDDISLDVIHLHHLIHYFNFMESRQINLNQFKMLSFEYKYVSSHIPAGHQYFGIITWGLPHHDEYVMWIKYFFKQIQNILLSSSIEKTDFSELLLRFVQSSSIDDCLAFLLEWYSQSYEDYSQASFPIDLVKQLDKICKRRVNTAMAKKYAGIFADAGFLSIARAINHCTTYALYIQNETDKSYPFKIRKELRYDLSHVRHDKVAFIDTLGDFIIDYQEESSELRKKGHIRHKVSLDDVTRIMILIDEFGIEIVSRLLLVAGYATHYPTQLPTDTEEGEV
ncbi:MAG: hypothetical protein AAF846_25690 [Chloroflexota bacterium]